MLESLLKDAIKQQESHYIFLVKVAKMLGW